MLSLASFNLCLALLSLVVAVAALALLAVILVREHRSSHPTHAESSRKVKRADGQQHPEWARTDALNPDFLQFHTLMFDKKKQTRRPPKNNQVMEVPREQIIDLSGLERMVDGESMDDGRRASEEPAIYENSVVFVEEERRQRKRQAPFVQGGSWSEEEDGETSTASPASLRSSTFTSSTSLADESQHEVDAADFGKSLDLSQMDTLEPPATKTMLAFECASPELPC